MDSDEDFARQSAPARPGRRAATRARKGRRRLLAVGGAGVVVLAVLALWATNTWPFGSSKAAPADSGLVTTFQKGEFRAVPNACSAISSTLLGQYLPGKVNRVSQSAGSATQSQCTWTLDAKPNFRVLTVSSQAYAPSLLATGNGSATFSAIDAYGQLMQGLQNPPKKSKLPKAQMGSAVGLGSAAFTALQVFHVGAVTDEVTVVVRDRNVLIDVTMQGRSTAAGSARCRTLRFAPRRSRRRTRCWPGSAERRGLSRSPRDLRWSTVLMLALDTATPAMTVALHDGSRVLAGRVTVSSPRARRAAGRDDRAGARGGRRRPRRP